MKKYAQKHSQHQLRTEWLGCGESLDDCPSVSSRKFVVGLYSCPEEVGNRLHAFMNALLLAVTTNRTFLWRYEDFDACLEYRGKDSGDNMRPFCAKEYYNTKVDCDQVLSLSDWIPSFEEWNARFKLPAAQLLPGPNNTHYDAPEAGVLVRTGYQFSPKEALLLPDDHKRSSKRLVDDDNKDVAHRLLAQGYLFTYGMFFESLFTLQPSLLPDPTLIETGNTSQTIFLHSRHPHSYMKADDVWTDRMCLRRLLENHTLPSCVVYIMSDRPLTVELLKAEVRNVSCIPVTINHTSTNNNPVRGEHGPNAGVGFFRDYALARNARRGFIAFHQFRRRTLRTSSSLILSTIEFRRYLEENSSKDLKSCVTY